MGTDLGGEATGRRSDGISTGRITVGGTDGAGAICRGWGMAMGGGAGRMGGGLGAGGGVGDCPSNKRRNSSSQPPGRGAGRG